MATTLFFPGTLESRLNTARSLERAGRVRDAADAYRDVVTEAESEGDARSLAEALRRLGGIQRRRNDNDSALTHCQRSYDVAAAAGDRPLAAEALNGIALVYMSRGEWDVAREYLRRALELATTSPDLRARIEQNLGIMANTEGDLDAALGHYRRSLEAFRAEGNESGCAIAYHNLGMVSADVERWDDAEGFFSSSLSIADAAGDVNARGHVLLNRTEVLLARGRYEEARASAEEALQIFDVLDARDKKATAYAFLGRVYRDTGRPTLAEARFQSAVDVAASVGATLAEAEASREMARLYQSVGRNIDSLRLLNKSHRLFGRLNARRDLVDVAGKMSHLESVYLEIVREWGASLESADAYTYGHSERVSGYATRIGDAMGCDAEEITTLRIGAYLHDLGKVRVPHEILNKPGRLTNEEFDVMKQHPVYGIEMLSSVEFPWDIKPLIRWHHEKVDGRGYPDGLAGGEIPLSAQIICAADVYDALTTTRSYRGAMDREKAVGIMTESRHWWREDVFDGFMQALAA